MKYEENVFFTKGGNHVVHVQTQKDSKIFSLELIFAAGSKYAAPGLSHLFEHCVFLGTATKDRTQVEEALMGVGGDYNAWTNKDAIGLSCSGLIDSFEAGLEILADMAFNCTLDRDIEAEKQVVLSETAPYFNDRNEMIDTDGMCTLMLYGKKGISEVGHVDSVKKYKQSHLLAFKEELFSQNRCYVSVVCPMSEYEVAKVVDRVLGKRTRSRECNKNIMIPIPGTFKKYAQVPGSGDFEVEIQMALPRASSSEKAFLREFVAFTLSAGELSCLFGPARKRGLVYTLKSNIFEEADCSVLSIGFGTTADFTKVEQTVELIAKNIRDAADTGIENFELFRKSFMFENYRMSQEPEVVCAMAATEFLKNRFILSFDSRIEALKEINMESYKKLLKNMLTSDSKAIAIVGPSHPERVADRLRKIKRTIQNM